MRHKKLSVKSIKKENNFMFGEWTRASSYEVMDDKFIIPSIDSNMKLYDPLEKNRLNYKNNKQDIFSLLVKIADEKDHKKQRRLVLSFVKEWGLIGRLTHSCNHYIISPLISSCIEAPGGPPIYYAMGPIIKNRSTEKKKVYNGDDLPEHHYYDASNVRSNFGDLKVQHMLSSETVFTTVQPIYKYETGQWGGASTKQDLEVDVNKIKDPHNGKSIPMELIKNNSKIHKTLMPGFYYDNTLETCFQRNENPLPDKEKNTYFYGFHERKDLFVDHFPRICKSIKKNNGLSLDELILYNKWPAPLSPFFDYEYAETFDDIIKLAKFLKRVFANFSKTDELGKKLKNSLNKDIGKFKDQEINIQRVVDMFQEPHYVSELHPMTNSLSMVPSIMNNKVCIRLASPSLIGYLGYMLTERLSSERKPKNCEGCGVFLPNPRPDAKYCTNNCKALYGMRRKRAETKKQKKSIK